VYMLGGGQRPPQLLEKVEAKTTFLETPRCNHFV